MRVSRPAPAVAGVLAAMLVLGGAPTVATGAGETPEPGTLSAAAVDENAAFVQAAYLDFLGREATQAEVTDAVNRLRAGTTPNQFLTGLARSPEWTTHVIRQMYLDTLGREPDAQGLAHWQGLLTSGQRTVAQVAGGFYSSAEYFGRIGGNTNRTWISDLYRKLLKREPDAAGLEFWVARTTQVGRGSVAVSFYQSLETRQTRVNTLYMSFLGRPAEPGGLATWTKVILSGDDLALAVSLAASSEYRQRAIARATGNLTFVAAGQQSVLSADGKWVLAKQSGALALFDLATRARTEVVSGDVQDYDISTDGQFVTYSSAGGTYAWSRANGQRVRIGDSGAQLRISGDGNAVALTRGDAVRLLTSTGADIELGKGSQPDISADGGTVAFATADGKLAIWSAADGTTKSVASPQAGRLVRQPSVSSDGSRVAYQAQDKATNPSVSEVWLYRRDTATNTQLTSAGVYSGTASISGNGRYVVFLSQAADLDGTDRNNGLDAFRAEPAADPAGVPTMLRLTGSDTTVLTQATTEATGNRVAMASTGALPGGTQAGVYVWSRG